MSIPSITLAEDVAQLRETYDRLFEGKVGRKLGVPFDPAGVDVDDSEAVWPQRHGAPFHAHSRGWTPR